MSSVRRHIIKETNIKKIFFILVLLSSFICLLEAEDKDPADSTSYLGGWFGMGLGKCYVGINGYYYFSVVYNTNIFTIRYLNADEFRFNPGGGQYDNPSLTLREKSLLYGKSYRKKYLLLSISAGIGYISGIDRGAKIAEKQYKQVNISTYGIPFEVKFRLNMGFIGFGGGWFGNINSQKFLSGGLIEISIGVY